MKALPVAPSGPTLSSDDFARALEESSLDPDDTEAHKHLSGVLRAIVRSSQRDWDERYRIACIAPENRLQCELTRYTSAAHAPADWHRKPYHCNCGGWHLGEAQELQVEDGPWGIGDREEEESLWPPIEPIPVALHSAK